ncbi:hypothetical protein [Pelagicoccus sp. SDUM812005]|uniref:hypothetical protein n=1 Tax=Pelagicoccus sp. SDUM812005 TaxID=3041257 RepID=UPI00280F231E|nr:hypothetical protein [Pelagicoccus sp. SDUM812005]MDQ8183036.1 hypothetical protein [Pelagicoccus sp. SDUM812005]
MKKPKSHCTVSSNLLLVGLFTLIVGFAVGFDLGRQTNDPDASEPLVEKVQPRIPLVPVADVNPGERGEAKSESGGRRLSQSEALFELAGVAPELYHEVQASMSDVLVLAMVEKLALEQPSQVSSVLDRCEASQRGYLSIAFVRSLSLQSPSEALQWILNRKGQLAGEDYESGLNEALSAYAKGSPAQAFEYLDTIEDSELRGNLAVEVAKGWAGLDVDRGLDWLRSLPDRNVPPAVLYGCYSEILGALALQDPKGAARELERLGSDRLQGELLPRIVSEMSRRDVTAALDLIAEQVDQTTRRNSVLALLDENVEQDVVAAIEVIAHHANLLDGEAEEVADLFARMSRTAPDLLISSFDDLPNHLRTTAAGSVLRTLLVAEGDAELAQEWVETLPRGEAFDRAAEAFAGHYAQRDPQATLQWAGKIEASERRAAFLSSYIERADTSALPAIAQSLRDAPIREEARNRSLALLNRRMDNELLNLVAR